jgi:hypothetical protein
LRAQNSNNGDNARSAALGFGVCRAEGVVAAEVSGISTSMYMLRSGDAGRDRNTAEGGVCGLLRWVCCFSGYMRVNAGLGHQFLSGLAFDLDSRHA